MGFICRISSVRAAGLYDYWSDYVLMYNGINFKNKHGHQHNYNDLRLENVFDIFFILIIGVILSILIFICELMYLMTQILRITLFNKRLKNRRVFERRNKFIFR